MKKTLEMSAITRSNVPEALRIYFDNALITDVSGMSSATTLQIEGRAGTYYLKVDALNSLKYDALNTEYFSKINLGPRLIDYIQDAYDFMLTLKIEGKSMLDQSKTHPQLACVIAYAKALRLLHDTLHTTTHVKHGKEFMLKRVEMNYRRQTFDTKIAEYLGHTDMESVYTYIQENKGLIVEDVILHGDYCLPNIFFDDDLNFIGIIDVNESGVGDRHYDVFWGMWTLYFNFGTRDYDTVFIDSYGREMIDEKRLNLMGAISCLDSE